MADKSAIEWTDATWNPVQGCDPVSPGCANCYAATMAARFNKPGQWGEGLAVMVGHKGKWTGEICLDEHKLDLPLRWTRPRKIFVNSQSDLFHEDVPREYIAAIFGVMSLSCHHTFQILTKRPERMLEELSDLFLDECMDAAIRYRVGLPTGNKAREMNANMPDWAKRDDAELVWPLPHIWLGVSAEDQQRADERIPLLLQTPAAVRFVSAEPLIEPISFRWKNSTPLGHLHPRHKHPLPTELGQIITDEYDGLRELDWIIVGGESGPDARPCDISWIRSIVQECQEAGVACFVKQLGKYPWHNGIGPFPPKHIYREQTGQLFNKIGWLLSGFSDQKAGNIDEWPADLRVREFPKL